MQKKHTIGFKCPTGAACRYVWRCAIEQMLFFTLPNNHSSNVMSGGGFFSWGAKFRYTGRTEREILSENISALKAERLANSSPSKRKANSVPATPSSPQGDLAEIRYSSLPRSTMSEPHGNCLDSMLTYATTDSGIPLLETVSEEIRNKSAEPSNDMLTDYYTFRDSFEHSSSESGFTNLTDTRIGMKAPPPPPPLKANGPSALDGGIASVGGAFVTASDGNHHHHNNATTVLQQNAANNAKSGGGGSGRKFSLVSVFVPSFIVMLTLLFGAAIFVIESDPESFKAVKQWPEMISLRYQYYEPAKKFVRELVAQLGRGSGAGE